MGDGSMTAGGACMELKSLGVCVCVCVRACVRIRIW